MPNTLIIFTGSYPYSSRAEETFIEPEIEVLSQFFPRIVLVPSSKIGTLISVREGIEVDDSLARSLWSEKGLSREFFELYYSLKTNRFYQELVDKPKTIVHFKSLLSATKYFGEAAVVNGWLKGFIDNSNIDVDHSIFYSYWFNGLTLGLALYKQKDKRIVITTRAHATDLYEERHPNCYIPAREWAIKQMNGVFTISKYGRDYLKSRYGNQLDQIEIGRLGVRAANFLTKSSIDDAIRIVSCSYVVPIKRIDLLIRGLEELSKITPRHIEWIHFGGGAQLNELMGMADVLLKNKLNYSFRGDVPNSDIISHYESNPVDIFVNTSKSEGIPVTIMEAYSHAIPAIAPDVGAINEIVSNTNGKLMSANPSPNEIALSIMSVINDKDKLIEYKKNALETWHNLYNYKNNYLFFSNKLREMIEHQKKIEGGIVEV